MLLRSLACAAADVRLLFVDLVPGVFFPFGLPTIDAWHTGRMTDDVVFGTVALLLVDAGLLAFAPHGSGGNT